MIIKSEAKQQLEASPMQVEWHLRCSFCCSYEGNRLRACVAARCGRTSVARSMTNTEHVTTLKLKKIASAGTEGRYGQYLFSYRIPKDPLIHEIANYWTSLQNLQDPILYMTCVKYASDLEKVAVLE